MHDGLTVVATVAAALREHPGDEGLDHAVDLLGHAGIHVSVSGGRVQLPAGLPPELRVALDAVFALAAARLADDELVATGRLTALGSLTSSVVHELNNPLFAVLALVEFLLRDLEPGTKAYSRLELIQETALGMKELAKALLDFAREQPTQLEPVALEEAIADVAELFRLAAAAKGVEIEQRFDGASLHVLGRRSELRQLLLSLFLNAKSAMPSGGTIAVELRRDGEHAVLRVADTGHGVPPELGGRAFEAFVTTRPETGAVGLGLTVARAIARRHGGELVHEPSAEGAAFVARLPLVPGGSA
jgi:signal transduction histidine kinase